MIRVPPVSCPKLPLSCKASCPCNHDYQNNLHTTCSKYTHIHTHAALWTVLPRDLKSFQDIKETNFVVTSWITFHVKPFSGCDIENAYCHKLQSDFIYNFHSMVYNYGPLFFTVIIFETLFSTWKLKRFRTFGKGTVKRSGVNYVTTFVVCVLPVCSHKITYYLLLLWVVILFVVTGALTQFASKWSIKQKAEWTRGVTCMLFSTCSPVCEALKCSPEPFEGARYKMKVSPRTWMKWRGGGAAHPQILVPLCPTNEIEKEKHKWMGRYIK